MSKTMEFLKNSLIVAAHPDDELLWFGSILEQVDRVVVVYEEYWPDPAIGPARAEAIANHPHHNIVTYQLPEAATYGGADWQTPKLSDDGIYLKPSIDLRDAKQRIKKMLGKGAPNARRIRETYNENFKVLVEKLRTELKPDMNVFAHNPWGEYGHEDHIQVFRALDLLRAEIGFKLWMSNYCTERALPLAMTYFDHQDHNFIQLPVSKDYCEKVADVYRDAGCWTWSDQWSWFRTECFLEAPTRQFGPTEQGNLLPLNMFNINPVRLIEPSGGEIAARTKTRAYFNFFAR